MNASVLIVEDDRSLNGRYAELVGFFALNTIRAYDGREGLEVYKEWQDEVGLVITALKLPRLCGSLMVAEILRINPNVKIAYVANKSPGLDTGQHRILHKPLRFRELYGLLRAELGILDPLGVYMTEPRNLTEEVPETAEDLETRELILDSGEATATPQRRLLTEDLPQEDEEEESAQILLD